MAACHSPVPCKEDKPCQHKIFITCECQRIKQEAKCIASTSNEGNSKKTLKCDEECARLERNRKLALALNVDPSHQTDHIPYSADTLNMYQQNSTWAAGQERDLRLFAANSEEKRFRSKPMPRKQRAFLHSLAEDFGFDSESMDPEPHRHVAIFKTPRFVMAPMKTLAECVRIRQVQRTTVAVPTSARTSRPKTNNVSSDPYNAFLITSPRFALTVEEIKTLLKSVLSKTSFALELDISFLPNEEVALKPPIAQRVSLPDREVQDMLESVKPALSEAVSSQKMGKLQLARLDASLNVLRKETDSLGAGWSQVAAKGAPAQYLQQSTPIGNKGGFAVLSLSSTKKKKEKQRNTEIVEDWEAAEEIEEEKERATSGANSGFNSEAEGSHSDRRLDDGGVGLGTDSDQDGLSL
jgi:transcriptional repressor NF-X1